MTEPHDTEQRASGRPQGPRPQGPGHEARGHEARGQDVSGQDVSASPAPAPHLAEPHLAAPHPAEPRTAGPRTAGPQAAGSLRARAAAGLGSGLDRVTGWALAPHQTAVVRIGFALTWLFFLLREWPHRHELYGPEGPWSWDMARRLIADNHAFTVLLWSDSAGWFEFVYLFAVAASVALLLGWRTRTASVLFMIGVLALQNRSVFMGDGGDNVVHLMSMYLVFTRCGQVWSLDARRQRREGGHALADATGVLLWSALGAVLLGASVVGGFSLGWGLLFWGLWAVQGLWWLLVRRAPYGEARRVCGMLGNLAHNGALLVIVVEVCLIYATAGWYKIQGSRWQDGTASYFPMHLDYFSPWPELTGWLAGSGVLILLITYGTVMVQVAFPFTLFNRRVKNVLLAAMILEHLSIAVLLGLPFFSLAMVAADAVFLPTAALLWLGARASGLGTRVRARFPGRRPGPGAEPEDGRREGAGEREGLAAVGFRGDRGDR